VQTCVYKADAAAPGDTAAAGSRDLTLNVLMEEPRVT
jgi:hypothetical protein